MNTRYGYIVRVNSVVRHHCNILCFIEEKNRMIRLKKNNNNKIDKEKKRKAIFNIVLFSLHDRLNYLC